MLKSNQFRIVALMAAVALAAILPGVALAETITCNNTPPCYGTLEGDDMTGTGGSETIYALGGGDIVDAAGSNDTVYGSSGKDLLYGQGASDKVYGGRGIDVIDAQTDDTAGSTDYSYGGRGNDEIHADDSNVDIIDCGKGTTDVVVYDVGIDTIKACEVKDQQ